MYTTEEVSFSTAVIYLRVSVIVAFYKESSLLIHIVYYFYLNFNNTPTYDNPCQGYVGVIIHIIKGVCYSTRLCFNRSAFQMSIHFKVCGYIILVIINHRSLTQSRTGTDISVQWIFFPTIAFATIKCLWAGLFLNHIFNLI